MLSLQTGYSAARRVFEDPAGQDWGFGPQNQQDIQSAYTLLWAYYSNEVFERIARFGTSQVWTSYKSAYSLYRNIRSIYNPTRRLVDFYAGQVYPGVLSADGKPLPEGVPVAIPFAEDTPEDLKQAIAQVWQWSNWQARKAVYVRYGAALGSVLVEVTDDLAREHVSLTIVWPGQLIDLDLDAAGNVKGYTLEYLSYDEEAHEQFTYRKEVDTEAFRYYRNREPWDYGDGAVVPNVYGFVPAAWVKHADSGSDIGSPAMAGSFPKIDELNNLASHAHDQIHKIIGAPAVLWSTGSVQNLFNMKKRGPSDEFVEPSNDQESVMMLKGSADGRVDSLAGSLSLSDTLMYMQEQLHEIEKDHPELTVFEELRAMSSVTGPAASRLVAPAIARLAESAANYDQQSIKLFQMAVAIGGMRVNSGAWRARSVQQAKFAGFDLSSYTSGNLDVAITPRPLLKQTGLEDAMEKQAYWAAVKAAVDAGVPLEMVLEKEGWTPEDIARLGSIQVAAIKQQQMLMQQDNVPMLTQGGQPNPAAQGQGQGQGQRQGGA